MRAVSYESSAKPKDYILDYLRHALQPGRELIDISPTHQRRLRWPNKKKSLLIESFLINIPVPPIFLFERNYNSYEVIDGRQQLDAMSSFLAGEYSLAGLEYWPELNKMRFEELPSVWKEAEGLAVIGPRVRTDLPVLAGSLLLYICLQLPGGMVVASPIHGRCSHENKTLRPMPRSVIVPMFVYIA